MKGGKEGSYEGKKEKRKEGRKMLTTPPSPLPSLPTSEASDLRKEGRMRTKARKEGMEEGRKE